LRQLGKLSFAILGIFDLLAECFPAVVSFSGEMAIMNVPESVLRVVLAHGDPHSSHQSPRDLAKQVQVLQRKDNTNQGRIARQFIER